MSDQFYSYPPNDFEFKEFLCFNTPYAVIRMVCKDRYVDLPFPKCENQNDFTEESLTIFAHRAMEAMQFAFAQGQKDQKITMQRQFKKLLGFH